MVRVRVIGGISGIELLPWTEIAKNLDENLRTRLARPGARAVFLRFGALLQRVEPAPSLDLAVLYCEVPKRADVDFALMRLGELRHQKSNVFDTIASERGLSPEFASAIADDAEVASAVVAQKGAPHYRWLSASKKGDRALALRALAHSCCLRFMSAELRADAELACIALSYGERWSRLDASLRRCASFMTRAVARDGLALRFADEALRADRQIVSAAVQRNGHALQFASAELRGDRDLVLAATRNKWHALQHASADLRHDREFVRAVAAQSALRRDCVGARCLA
jgi:hypothetical protein